MTQPTEKEESRERNVVSSPLVGRRVLSFEIDMSIHLVLIVDSRLEGMLNSLVYSTCAVSLRKIGRKKEEGKAKEEIDHPLLPKTSFSR